jgi:hypothetical protein
MYAMITHHDEKYKPLADLTWEQNKVAYAAEHGYAVYAKTEDFMSSDGKSATNGFEKIYLAREILDESPEVEWLWWTGTDSMVTNFSTKIEHRINNDYHFMICVDVNGINADSFLVRNTPEAKAFLDHVQSLESACSKFWDTEQRAISYALGFPGTSEQGWPFGDDLKVCEQYKNVVKLLPQRYMNGFNYQLYHYTDHRDKLGVNGNWSFGDWLIHWPACSIDVRIQLYNHYKGQIVR